MMFKTLAFLNGIFVTLLLTGPAQAAVSPAPKTVSAPETTSALKTASVPETASAPKIASAPKRASIPGTASIPKTVSALQTASATQAASAPQTTSAPQTANDPQTISTPTAVSDPENPVLSPGASTAQDEPEPPVMESPDALSNYNRVVFHFNDTLDRMILKPVATLYNKIVPRPLHKGITNFFSNIDNLPTIVNDVLQIKIYCALSDSWRLFVNSTFGLLGFIDVGSRIGLPPHHEDFGLTLAHWGYKSSNYFVVPFFGPGTIRDVLGWPVDYFLFSIYPHISNNAVRYSLYGVGVVDRRANLLQYQDVFEQVAIDRYVFMRNAYLQHRSYQIEENETPRSVSAKN